MAISPLIKHAYNHGTEEVIRRGKRIFHTSGVQLLDFDSLIHQVRFRVRNDEYKNHYTVTINRFDNLQKLNLRCQCPYNLSEICRHEVAALFQLSDMVLAGFFENIQLKYDQKNTILRMRSVSRELISHYAGIVGYHQAEELIKDAIITILSSNQGVIEASVQVKQQPANHIVLKQNDERYFETSCNCTQITHPLCTHKAAVFLYLVQKYGVHYFDTMQNWKAQKNKLLAQYGYTVEDDLNGKFEFYEVKGKPFLKVLDASIQKIIKTETTHFKMVEEPQIELPQLSPLPIEEDLRLGIVLDSSIESYPYFQIQLIKGKTNETITQYLGGIEILQPLHYLQTQSFDQNERQLLTLVRKTSFDELLKYIKKSIPFGDFIDNYKQALTTLPEQEIKLLIWEYLLPKYQQLVTQFDTHPLCFWRQTTAPLTSKNLVPVKISEDFIEPQLQVINIASGVKVSLIFKIGDTFIPFQKLNCINAGIYVFNHVFYTLPSPQLIPIVEQFQKEGFLEIATEKWSKFLESEILNWNQLCPVVFEESFLINENAAPPNINLYLNENDAVISFQPSFVYDGIEKFAADASTILSPKNGKVNFIERDFELENKILNQLMQTHENMVFVADQKMTTLPASVLLTSSWFFDFLDQMKEQNITVFGIDNFKKFRININRPKTELKIGSNIDWFDVQMDIIYGGQRVKIEEIKRALAARQTYVTLPDGSLGLLPDEWMKKYALLIKMAEGKDKNLKLKKIHFSVLDDLLNEIDDEKLQIELEEKKENISKIIDQDFSNVLPPAFLSNALRPYQVTGFQWVSFLQEAGWGGILADDMGLGKTLQALTAISKYCQHFPHSKHLVICPTTLLYNWEKEIQKFTPELSYQIYHGPKRKGTPETFNQHQIFITTYGTVRSDIKMMKSMVWDYIILDESQAIKNPQSQVTKAALLLNGKHKIALSGTPVQNNTFDLYAQMNFLNPGILGSREFFMNEFAQPIDRFQDAEVKMQLKKLTYPFILRRTKENVAKDLPEKTETTLYCEMGKEQRKIYEAYRNLFQDKILGIIDEKGIENAHMHILQGLTKLRQICDSPAILNEEDQYPNYSIKQEMLMNELLENIGQHKALVFSQFLGMLGLLRKALEEKGIPYSYFDGSSSVQEREKAINEFQNIDSNRVFLISLKAGGVGLNLTAADYVYLIDPWWNPAVEQQAIDRTHRIGQDKNIFAYRLICKDTIEEKMMELQNQKRLLAKDLVSDDTALFKKMTRDDIAYLLAQ